MSCFRMLWCSTALHCGALPRCIVVQRACASIVQKYFFDEYDSFLGYVTKRTQKHHMCYLLFCFYFADGKSTLTIVDLMPNTVYAIHLSAGNVVGFSDKVKFRIMTTNREIDFTETQSGQCLSG